MVAYLMLVLALAAPVVLRLNGKRWLGGQTHPAAVFILAWIACSLLLSSVDFITASTGAIALIWVVITFAGLAIADKLRRKSPAERPLGEA